MKKIFILLLIITLGSVLVLAHPTGKTDSHGCHTCRTNCGKWGLQNGEYHCHAQKNTEKPQSIPKQNMTLFKVISITDGDTIKVNINGKTEIVRLLGIDSPELDKKECFSKEAKLEMSKFTKNKSVKLEKDSIQPDRDRYKRLLRYISLENGTLVNEEMVKEGYAFAYRKSNSDKLKDFIKLENEAKNKRLGLWGSCSLFFRMTYKPND